jgi:DNA repair protein RadC
MIYLKDSKLEVKSSRDIAKGLVDLLHLEDEIDQAKEHFYVIHFDTRSRINMVELVNLGTLTSSVTHPRETYRRAVIHGSAAIIVAHNHPSGQPDPSTEDMKVTKLLMEAGRDLGIDMLDHIVFSETRFFSFRDNKEEPLTDEK